MKERLSKLLTVKSIVTLALTALFIGVAAFSEIPQEVMTIYTTVIAFYFGTQTEKKKDVSGNV
jgi:hypothetical protein